MSENNEPAPSPEALAGAIKATLGPLGLPVMLEPGRWIAGPPGLLLAPGAALAQAYARQGAVLGLVARRHDVLEQLRSTLEHPERHHVFALDVTDHVALRAAAEAFIAAAGGADIVIANAGISQGTLTEYVEDLPHHCYQRQRHCGDLRAVSGSHEITASTAPMSLGRHG